MDIKAYNDFVVPDGFDDQTPQPKRIKTVATTEATAADQTQTDEPIIGKRKKPAKVKKERKPRVETPTSAPDCAQSAEEARFRKQKNVTELMEVMKKRLEFSRPLIMASAQDKKVKKESRKSMSVLAPALSSGCGLDSEFVNIETRSVVQDMHQGKTEAPLGLPKPVRRRMPTTRCSKLCTSASTPRRFLSFPASTPTWTTISLRLTHSLRLNWIWRLDSVWPCVFAGSNLLPTPTTRRLPGIVRVPCDDKPPAE